MKRTLNITLVSFLLVSTFAVPSAAQHRGSSGHFADWTLSMLRGNWVFHTFEEKYSLLFESDKNVIVDGRKSFYSLLPNVIRVNDGDNTTDYPYVLDANQVSLTLPDGTTRAYSKRDAGESEQSLYGRYYALVDTTSDPKFLAFDGDHTFILHDEYGTESGVYRIGGTEILLTVDDTTVYAAQARWYDEDGPPAEITFNGRIYESVLPSPPDEPIVGYIPAPPVPKPPHPWPNPNPPGYPCPRPPYVPPTYVPPIHVQPAPTVSTTPPARTEDSRKDEPVRTFGSARPHH